MHIFARIYATKQSRSKSLATNIGTIPKNMPTNFQLKRLKLKLDIVKKPENRVHELTDSNGSRCPPAPRARMGVFGFWVRSCARARQCQHMLIGQTYTYIHLTNYKLDIFNILRTRRSFRTRAPVQPHCMYVLYNYISIISIKYLRIRYVRYRIRYVRYLGARNRKA